MKSIFFTLMMFTMIVPSAFSHVFGTDNRQYNNGSRAPYNRIGLLLSNQGDGCTASLVGSNLILTAGHCVINHETDMLIRSGYRFILPDGVETGATFVQRGAGDMDWAILRLVRSLGNAYGYFEIASSYQMNQIFSRSMSIAGYGGNNYTSQEGCRIRKKSNDGRLFYHDCDTEKGDSGAPVFYCTDVCEIAGVHESTRRYIYYSDDGSVAGIDYANEAVSVDEFRSVILLQR
jgi:V8-like Glu-specific endopeptidase